ncbi:MAG: ATP-binding protein [Halothiobacillaceae bacterium]|nr:ATP-binding protein [Halothiobacillaceae bacterium]
MSASDFSAQALRGQLYRLHLYLGLAALAWTLTFGGIGWYLIGQLHGMTMELARKEAESNFNKDQAFRFWGTLHGGVYVEVSDKTPRSPWLAHIPERDLVTPSGRQLTLMNPAYMLRELNEQFGELFGVRGHITSLMPLRAENAPDAWERRALEHFKRGGGEVMEVSDIEGKPYLRFMAPMLTQQGCLVCHAHQGYKVGDIRGGVSVAVPLSDYQKREQVAAGQTLTAMCGVWLLGILGLLVGRQRLVRDMRRQYEANVQIARLNVGLEELVRERTVEMEEARDRAEAANRAKSVFLANMSHELRTPLNAILGFSELTRHEAGLTPRQRENLEFVHRNGEHLLSLINDVLDMAKIESGRQSLEEETVDLPRALEDAVEMLRPRAETKGMRLNVDIDPALPRYIRCDGRKLRQILINLISNAVKYSDQGEVQVEVLRRGGEGGGAPLLHIEIIDQGRGIAAEDQERIFDPFVQAGHAGTTEGTGLGLPITRQFVELMGGEIAVSSTPGAGSCFSVRLPLVEAHADDASEAEPVRRVLGLAEGQPPWRVLVVDDSDANRLLLKRVIEGAGFDVREASNGQEAVEVFNAWHPHFIWMDMRMPVMDGYEAARTIRNSPGSRQTVIAALTASTSTTQQDQARVFASGCVALLRKPFQPSDIFETMRRYLKVQYRYAEPEDEVAPPPAPTDLHAPLAALPEAARAELRSALRAGDLEALERFVSDLEVTNPALARALREPLDAFRYDELLAALGAEDAP